MLGAHKKAARGRLFMNRKKPITWRQRSQRPKQPNQQPKRTTLQPKQKRQQPRQPVQGQEQPSEPGPELAS
jgi:hypothetical protein